MNNKKSILFVVSQLSTGGAERVISILANYFASADYPVYLILFRNEKKQYDLHANIRTVVLDEPKNKLIKLIYRIKYIRNFISRNKIDTYITFEHFYGISCSAGKKIIYITSMRNDPNNDEITIIERFARFFNFRFTSHVVFQTENIKNYFCKSIQERGILIKNPISSQLPEYHGVRIKEVVAVCRLEKQKNIPMLLNAFKEFIKLHKEYKLKIYGDGSMKAEIVSMIHEMELSDYVFLMGFQTNIAEKIMKSSMYVCTSNYEGLSNSMLEALAIGLPVITTDSSGGGAREIITDGENGFLVEVGNYIQMAEKMSLIADNLELSNRISRRSVEIRNILSEVKVCKEWAEVL